MAERISITNVNFLVIDRHVHMRELLVGVLRTLGGKDIRAVGTYDAAKEALSIKPPEIMFTSWKLDPTNGVELTREIRWSGKEALQFTPIIMVSGHGEEEKVLKAREAGINEFVVKPYAAATILSRMHAVIMKPRQFVKTEQFFGPDRRRTTAFEYSGDERRFSADDENVVKKPGKKKGEMSQKEINDLMNPDDVEASPEEDGAHFEADATTSEKDKPAVQDA